MGNILKTSYVSTQINEIFSNCNLFSYEEIFEKLNNKNTEDFVKIFSILNIEEVRSQEDFYTLVFHLTNHSNPIREVTSLKLEELSLNFPSYFLNEYLINQLVLALIDINPNVSRSICSIINNSKLIQELILPEILFKIDNLALEIRDYEIKNKDYFDKKTFNRKNHAKNKKLFSLYWLLEGLSYCLNEKYIKEITKIISYTINFNDYTIREKSAKILTLLDKIPNEILNIIKSEQNFYVKNLLYDKINIEE